jgi:transposase-like protein
MPCQTCAHPERPALDAALRTGASVTQTAHAFGLSRSSVRSHAERRHYQAAPAPPAAAVVNQVGTMVPTLPTSERQARPRLPPPRLTPRRPRKSPIFPLLPCGTCPTIGV